MTQTLAKTNQSLATQIAQELNISPSFLQLVKNTFAKDATDDELSLFLQTAKRTGLDPAARQIFMVPRWDSQLKTTVKSIQISIDGFRLIADRTGKYAPSREPSFVYDEKGNLVSATAYIKKLVGGQWHEIAATAFYSEYVQKTKEGKPNSMWAKMPRLMTAKCAESLVLRRAFPAELSGLYTADEMGTAETPTVSDLREIQYEITHEEKMLPIQKPQVDADDPINKQLSDVCSDLNNSGDSINWTKAQLNAYASTLFGYEIPLPNAFDLPIEEKQILLDDLQQRLVERQAISSEPEIIEGEIEQ